MGIDAAPLSFPLDLTLVSTLLLSVQCVAEDKLAPTYEDRANLLFFNDDTGKLSPVKSPTDWARRVSHFRASIELVMGSMPEKTFKEFAARKVGFWREVSKNRRKSLYELLRAVIEDIYI